MANEPEVKATTPPALPMITSDMWDVQANEQAYEALTLAALNSTTLPTVIDPIYKTLVQQINDTVYHKMRVEQNWAGIGTTHAPDSYPGILRELAMVRRKGQNFAMDADPRPTTFGQYPIIDDELLVRYHSMQVRWMYGYSVFDEELRRFSNGPSTIGEIHEMKAINMASARNMFMDSFRKQALYVYATQVATAVVSGIDISDFASLTVEQAKQWLMFIDMLLFVLNKGTNLYNGIGEFMQTKKARLQVVIPYQYWKNVINRAFPDTFHLEGFENIMPENMVFVDDLGGSHIMSTDTTPVALAPTFNSVGMNQLNWTKTSTVANTSDLQCVIMDKFALGFEDNLNETLTTPKDAQKLVSNVYNHFWTKAYVSDMVAGVAVKMK